MANQSATSMLAQAWKIVFWAGIDSDVAPHALKCKNCKEISPS